MKGRDEAGMKTNNIKINPDRLDIPLAQCVAGKLSSAVLILYGDIPDDVEDVAVQIERVSDEVSGERPANYSASASEVQGASPRSFRCYLAPWYFPEASEDLKYHVLGLDAHGNPRWLGSGALRVLENPSNGSAVTPDLVPVDTYIRNPVTGLYHKLTAAVDEDGNLTIKLTDEGVER